MPEASTLIRKHVIAYCDEHPEWSHSQIARELDATWPDLVEDLLTSRRDYILNQWVNRIVSEFRIDQRDRLKSGEILAAISPDGAGILYRLADMSGVKVVELGNRYLAAGARLTKLGEFYVHIGGEAGRKKIKSVFDESELRTIYERFTGGTG